VKRIKFELVTRLDGIAQVVGSTDANVGSTDDHKNDDPAIYSDHIGDEIIWSNPLFAPNDTIQVGFTAGTSFRLGTRNKLGEAGYESSFTMILSDKHYGVGEFTSQGPWYTGGHSTFAVTGGTGDFFGARGSVECNFVVNPDPSASLEYAFIIDIEVLNQ